MIVGHGLGNFLVTGGRDRYGLPLVGSSFRSLDQYADYQKMYADYMRNVGRPILYPSIRDYRSNAMSSLSTAFSPIANFTLKTSRSLL